MVLTKELQVSVLGDDAQCVIEIDKVRCFPVLAWMLTCFRTCKDGDLGSVDLVNPERTIHFFTVANGPTRTFVVSDLPRALAILEGDRSGSSVPTRSPRSRIVADQYAHLVARAEALEQDMQDHVRVLDNYRREERLGGKPRRGSVPVGDEVVMSHPDIDASGENDVVERVEVIGGNSRNSDYEEDGRGAARLVVEILEARQLSRGGWSKPNPSVVVTCNRQQLSTSVQRRTVTPWWNHTMVFRFPHPSRVDPEQLPVLKLAVMDNGMGGGFLGGAKVVGLHHFGVFSDDACSCRPGILSLFLRCSWHTRFRAMVCCTVVMYDLFSF